MRFSLPDPWARHLFIALCRRYDLRPYRYPRMRQQSVMLRAPQSFLDKVLWPEFQEINAALTEYLAQPIERVIREAQRTPEMPKRLRSRRSWAIARGEAARRLAC